VRKVAVPVSEAQKALFHDLVNRPCFTTAERTAWNAWLDTKATMRTCSDHIDWMKVEAARRTPMPADYRKEIPA